MSIESLLERIAVALESRGPASAGIATDAAPTKAPGKKKSTATTDAAAPTATQSPDTSQAPAQSPEPAAPAVDVTKLMQVTADTVIDLANNYSRDAALTILRAHGGEKVSQIAPAKLNQVLAEAQAKIVELKAAKANESLV